MSRSTEILTITSPRTVDLARIRGSRRSANDISPEDVALALVGTSSVAYAAARWRVTGDVNVLPVLQAALADVLDRVRMGRHDAAVPTVLRERLIGVAIGLERRRLADAVLMAVFGASEDAWRQSIAPALAELERALESWNREAGADMGDLLDGEAA